MILDLVDVQSPISTGNEPVMVTEQSGKKIQRWGCNSVEMCRRYSPSDHVFCFFAQMNIIGDYEVMQPVNNFLVRFMGRLGAKRWIPDKAFKHDGAQRPPIALTAIALLQEDLGCDVVWRSDSRVGLM